MNERFYYTKLYFIPFLKDTWPAFVAVLGLLIYSFMFVI